MYTLGINGSPTLVHEESAALGWPFDWFHDASAVLLEDGAVVAGVAQERLDRVKHSNAFPIDAVRFCLDRAGIGLSDVDRIAYPCDEAVMDAILLSNARQVVRGKALPLSVPGSTGRDILRTLLERAFSVALPPERLVFVRHHHAHAMSAFAHSGFEEALVYVRDGWGDDLSGIVAVGRSGTIEQLDASPETRSLGHLYLTGTEILGYHIGDEYKVMGLAPYGDPAPYRALLDRFVDGDADGGGFDLRGLWDAVVRDLGGVRGRGEVFGEKHRHVAAAFQRKIEDIALGELRRWRERTGQRDLCCAGGVAQNCSLNGKIRASGLFDRVFVPAAPDDGGLSLGAALAACAERRPGAAAGPVRQAGVFWGSAIPRDDPTEAVLRRWSESVAFSRVDDVVARAAQALADGKVIGWARGRSEFGPRALGSRSILADPRPERNRARINRIVKKREAFRPFAPSVIEEALTEYFEIDAHDGEFAFMTFVVMVRERYRALLGAVTHVDGSARVQSVARDANPDYWALIAEFGRITGTPILLNTSFNNNAEPIVETAEDAIACFLTTDLDHLVLGDFWVDKRGAGAEICGRLVPSLPAHCVVERTGAPAGGERFAIRSRRECRAPVEIDESLFAALSRPSAGGPVPDVSPDRLYALWSARLIRMAPPENGSAARGS